MALWIFSTSFRPSLSRFETSFPMRDEKVFTGVETEPMAVERRMADAFSKAALTFQR